MKELLIAKIIRGLVWFVHLILSVFLSEELLLEWKFVHLCWWFEKHGLEIPKYFIAGSAPPSVTTNAATSVTSSTAYGNGNVTSAGDASVTERGFAYSVTATNSNPEIGGTGVTKVTDGASGAGALGVYSIQFTSLSSSTQYSFKAYAINSKGTSYGSALTFTTSAAALTGDSERGLYSKGKDTSNSERGLYTTGSLSSSSERAVYTEGSVSTSSERSLYTKGIATSSSERSIHTIGSIDQSSERLIHTIGDSTNSSERNIYTQGGSSAIQDSSERLLYTKGKEIIDSQRGVYTRGSDTDSSQRSLYTKGGGDTVYSRENSGTLNGDDSDLVTTFSSQDYLDVAEDDNTYLELTGVEEYFTFLFKVYNSNNTQEVFTVTWSGKSILATSIKTVFLQVYNRTLSEWETIDSDSSTASDTEFSLTGGKTESLGDYYDSNYVISCRVYQDGN